MSDDEDAAADHSDNENDRQYTHGNYPNYYYRRYYQKRGSKAAVERDPRIDVLKRELPHGARMLDVGCNVGTLSARLAHQLDARSLLGVDIDASLVSEASLRYANDPTANLDEFVMHATPRADGSTAFPFFPANVTDGSSVSADVVRARLERLREQHARSPAISFRAEDYVATPAAPGELFDVILCLSVSKWIHLNGGDDAVRALFRKCFAQLAPGGIFVFEMQPWSSYRSQKSMFPAERVAAIKFRPVDFHAYLMSDQVGFVDSKQLQFDVELKSFKRTMQIYFKRADDQQQ
jgi:7SK snRNA methylphosphate capping enzyme